MPLSRTAKRLLAGGARALALDTDPDSFDAIGLETSWWLQKRVVVFHLRDASMARDLIAFVSAFDCSSVRTRFCEDQPGIELTLSAPWTVVAMVTLNYVDDLTALRFPEQAAHASRSSVASQTS